MTTVFRPCILVPTYNNPLTLERVVSACRRFLGDVVIVDDGSSAPGAEAVDALANEVHTVRRSHNGGKGAAVKSGFGAAIELGFTHAFQIDADGQHDLERIPEFLSAAKSNPEALVLGYPIFDTTAPAGRLRGRMITRFWVDFEAGKQVIADAMVGFRVYPLTAAVAAAARGNRMEFDPEIAVRMVWRGTPVINLPVAVRYLTAAQGGVSHFRMLRDNVRISWMHTRLATRAIIRRVLRWLRISP